MNRVDSQRIQCPYCGEVIEVLIDLSEPQQNYIEDCQVCCRPISFDVSVDDEGEVSVWVAREDD